MKSAPEIGAGSFAITNIHWKVQHSLKSSVRNWLSKVWIGKWLIAWRKTSVSFLLPEMLETGIMLTSMLVSTRKHMPVTWSEIKKKQATLWSGTRNFCCIQFLAGLFPKLDAENEHRFVHFCTYVKNFQLYQQGCYVSQVAFEFHCLPDQCSWLLLQLGLPSNRAPSCVTRACICDICKSEVLEGKDL